MPQLHPFRKPSANRGKKPKMRFRLFQFIIKKILRVSKSQFWISAPNLPHPCGSSQEGEAARFFKVCPFYRAAREKTPLRTLSLPNGGVALKSRKFVSSARNKFRKPAPRGKPPRSAAKPRARGVVFRSRLFLSSARKKKCEKNFLKKSKSHF